MTSRGLLALGVLAAWGAGVAVFIQREGRRAQDEQLTEAAMRASPGATFAVLSEKGAHVGFASWTVDTVPGGLLLLDQRVRDRSRDSLPWRSTERLEMSFSRSLILRRAVLTASTGPSAVLRVEGDVIGDSTIRFVRSHSGRTDTTVARFAPPLLPISMVPRAIALGKRPSVGDRFAYDVLDLTTASVAPLHAEVAAESMFVVVDSAVFAAATGRWVGVHADTVRGWRIIDRDSPQRLDTWIDDLGHIILERGADYDARRHAYETAFENWRSASPLSRRAAAAPRHAMASRPLDSSWTVVSEVQQLAVDGPGQVLIGDTVLVRRLPPPRTTGYYLPTGDAFRATHATALRVEPFLEVEDANIVAMARRIRQRTPDPLAYSRRLVRWVADSIRSADAAALPSAVGTLRLRAGDDSERAQLFVALSRAAGVPARLVTGIWVTDSIPTPRTWSEVFVGRWIPVDPTRGQMPADARHLRLLLGGAAARERLASHMTANAPKLVRFAAPLTPLPGGSQSQ